MLVVHFEGIKLAVRRQSFGQAQGGIAAVSAKLERQARTDHLHEHLEQPALQVAGGHARIEQAQVGVAVEGVQVVALCVYVRKDVFVEGHGKKELRIKNGKLRIEN